MHRPYSPALSILSPKPERYTLEFLLSLKDTPYCKEKPADLPEIIDREKLPTETGPNRTIRKQRRQGSNDGDMGEATQPQYERDPNEDYRNRARGGHPSGRRENNGWQPSNHQEHEDQFINRAPGPKAGAPRAQGGHNDNQTRIIPGKGVPRRPNSDQPPHSGPPHGAKSTGSNNWEHQPALANVVSRQQQGFTGAVGHATANAAKGLDAFSMGDIRQAEKFLESGRMGLDEYARKVATGEISRDFAPQHSGGAPGGFFADEDDSAPGSRPWMAGMGGRMVPGAAVKRPVASPPPPPSFPAPRTVSDAEAAAKAQQLGKESNASGLALLQMLIDRKAVPAKAPQTATVQSGRQLTQQQINDLIAMSKRTGPKVPQPATGAPVQKIDPRQMAAAAIARRQPGGAAPQVAQQRQMPAHDQARPVAPAVSTPPHVAALLEQLHRQQMAQQQTTNQPPAASAQPQECQQQ